MDTKRIINSHSTRGINTDDMCRICGSKNRRFIALFRSDGTSCDITDYICCYLGISVRLISKNFLQFLRCLSG